MGAPSWQMILWVGGGTFVTLGALLVLALLYQRHLGIVPGGRVERISGGSPPPAAVEDVAADDIMVRNRRIVIGAHRLRSTLRTRTENRELTRARTENRDLKRQLRDITEGQVKGIDMLLDAERRGKPLTRTGAALLMGKSKSEALQLIRDREPVPDEIARPEPIPAH